MVLLLLYYCAISKANGLCMRRGLASVKHMIIDGHFARVGGGRGSNAVKTNGRGGRTGISPADKR